MKLYLIDDKRKRQSSDYHWSSERFEQFKEFIQCIYTLEELEEKNNEIFSEDNIIIYHESFLDQTTKAKEAQEKRNKLTNWSKSKKNLLIYFSGSMNSRELNDNIAFIPVSTLYANLEIFINKITQNEVNLEYLLFGENINIEKDLIKKQELALNATFKENPYHINGTNLFINPSKYFISSPILDIEEKTIFSDVSDQKLSQKINEWLNNVKYDNLFIPLCFGNSLSDFNGLRLAAHIRCTVTFNQLSRIFIYGFVGIDFLLQNEYFNILKTKNICLIPFSKKAFMEYSNFTYKPLTISELPADISKLQLNIPKNYDDSHSIANEFGIYQLAYNAGIDINEITDFDKHKLDSLYFKWLVAKNGLYEELPREVQQENKIFRNEIRLKGPTIVGKIDLTKIPQK